MKLEIFNSKRKTLNFIDRYYRKLIKENPELKFKYLSGDEKTKLMCLSGVKQYPMRVKCATLSWHTMVSAFDEKTGEVKT